MKLNKIIIFILMLMFSINTVNAVIIETDVAAWWDFKEGSGTTIEDETGVYNGTFQNSPSWDGVGIPSNLSGSIDFTATGSDWIETGDIDLTTAITICVWAYDDIPTNGATLVSKRDNPNYAWELNHGNLATNGVFRINANSNLAGGAGSTMAWDFVCGTYDKTNIKYYINGGTPKGTTSYTADINSNNVNVAIGRRSYLGAESYFDGDIAQVIILNKAATQAEIDDLYNGGAGKTYWFAPEPPVSNVTIISNASTFYNVSNPSILLETVSGDLTNMSYTQNGGSLNSICTNCNTSILNLSAVPEGLQEFVWVSSNGVQVNSSDNSTFDYTAPSIVYLPNTTDFDTFFLNFSNIYDVTDNLSGLASCTINITDYENVTNPDNFLINCTDSQTFIHAGTHNFFLETIDNAGNTNISNINVTINPLINVFFNDTQNSTIIVGYTSTIYHPDGRVTSGEVTATGATLLSPVNNGSLDLGLHTIQFAKVGYTTTNVTVLVNATNAGTNYTFNVTRAAVNINIFNKNDFSLITGTNFSLEFVGPTGFTTSTTTGTTSIDGIFAPGTYRLIVSNVDYTTETVFFTFANTEQLNVSVYMDNVSTAGFVIIEVINPNGQPLSSVLVQALQWDSTSSSFIEVAEQNTAANGKGTLNIIVNTKLYKFKATKDGVSVESPQQTISSSDSGSTITLTLNLEEQQTSGFLLEDIIYSATESFNNNTNISTVIFNWVNTVGSDVTGCINTYRLQNNNEVLVGGEQCTTSDTAEITRNVLINGTYDYVIKAEFKQDDNSYLVAAKFLKLRDANLFKQLEDYKIHYFTLIFLNILSIFAGIKLQSILIGTIGLMVSSLLAIVIAPSLMTSGVALFSLFVGVIIILGGSNK